MDKEMVRTNVVVPKDLVALVDELVGRRSRSKFFKEAIQEKLERDRLAKVARELVGSLAGVETPGWETTAAAAGWVRAARNSDDGNLARRWEER